MRAVAAEAAQESEWRSSAGTIREEET